MDLKPGTCFNYLITYTVKNIFKDYLNSHRNSVQRSYLEFLNILKIKTDWLTWPLVFSSSWLCWLANFRKSDDLSSRKPM